MTSVLLAVSGVAGADTAHPCAVRIARAPAAIRAEIERWLAGESSCNVALEVRVVATEGGYYLLARDVRGRVRERIVPDGASAGVLVASWASDDQLGNDEPAPNIQRPAELDGDDDDDDAARGSATPAPVVAPIASPVIATREVAAPPAEPASAEWLRVDVLTNVAGVGGTGLRGEADVWQWRGWSTGVAAALAYSKPSIPYDFGGFGSGMTNLVDADIDVLAYIARMGNIAGWFHWRGSLGAGVRYSSMSLPNLFTDPYTHAPEPASTSATRPTLQASLLAGAELGQGWALEAGVLVSAVTPETVSLDAMTYSGSYDVRLDAAIGLQLFGGLAHRL